MIVGRLNRAVRPALRVVRRGNRRSKHNRFQARTAFSVQSPNGSNRLSEAVPNQRASHDQIDLACPHFAQSYHPGPSADRLEKNALQRTARAQILAGARLARCGCRAASPPVSCTEAATARAPEGIPKRSAGGEGGIRTPDTVARMPHFECGAFNHSATSPAEKTPSPRLLGAPLSSRAAQPRQAPLTSRLKASRGN